LPKLAAGLPVWPTVFANYTVISKASVPLWSAELTVDEQTVKLYVTRVAVK
jgi:hypothetical protein